jgi:hypothetical protein
MRRGRDTVGLKSGTVMVFTKGGGRCVFDTSFLPAARLAAGATERWDLDLWRVGCRPRLTRGSGADTKTGTELIFTKGARCSVDFILPVLLL